MTAIPNILLTFVLTLELRRTRLPSVLVKALPIGILHELHELPGDVGLHLKSSSSKDSSVSLLLIFKVMRLLLPDLPILVNPSSYVCRLPTSSVKGILSISSSILISLKLVVSLYSFKSLIALGPL